MKKARMLCIAFVLMIMGAAAGEAAGSTAEDWAWAYYAVQPGDEMAWLSRAYGVAAPIIRQINLLKDDALIPGQILSLPVNMIPGMEYGTLFLSPNGTRPYYTAAHFGVSTDTLEKLNYFPEEERLLKGQILAIPARHAVAAYPDVARLLQDSYIVMGGESVSEIAALFGVEEASLRRMNGIRDGERLYPGRILHLGRIEKGMEAPRMYAVQKGDTLSRIAGRFSISMDALVSLNDLPDKDRLVLGQILVFP